MALKYKQEKVFEYKIYENKGKYEVLLSWDTEHDYWDLVDICKTENKAKLLIERCKKSDKYYHKVDKLLSETIIHNYSEIIESVMDLLEDIKRRK